VRSDRRAGFHTEKDHAAGIAVGEVVLSCGFGITYGEICRFDKNFQILPHQRVLLLREALLKLGDGSAQIRAAALGAVSGRNGNSFVKTGHAAFGCGLRGVFRLNIDQKLSVGIAYRDPCRLSLSERDRREKENRTRGKTHHSSLDARLT
jgi:hypothetical protein